MIPVQKVEAKICYHCGDKCFGDPIHLKDKDFCCEGCKLVFELLDDNNLCSYYSLNEKSGVKVKASSNGRFAFLDDNSVASHLYRFKDNKNAVVQFSIPGIHCSSCIYLLERLHTLNKGVMKSEVNFLKKEVTINFKHQETSLREVVELMVRLGYEPELSMDALENKGKRTTSRRLIYQIGLTGFAFGNIMLLSFPEYLAGENDLSSVWKSLFGYLNLILALPVVVYGAQDYFVNAYKGLREKYFNIDLPIALGILAMLSRSSFEIITHTGAGYFDSMCGLIFFLLLGRFFQNKTYETLSFERDYKSYFPLAVQLKGKDGNNSIAVSKLKPTDKIIIHSEEVIPADAILLSPHASIDYSFVTGESLPVLKKKGDSIYAGGRQKGSAIELEVSQTVSQSYLTRLWNNDAFTKKKGENISRLADTISKYFTIVIILIAVTSFVYWYPQNIKTAIQALTAVLIIACPCALAITVPFTMGHVVRYLGRTGFYVKNTAVIETLAKCDSIVFDKTGTLSLQDESDLNFVGDELTTDQKSIIASLTYQSSHPLSRTMYESLKNFGVKKVRDFVETPGNGITGIVEGKKVMLGSAAFVGAEKRILINNQTVFVKIENEVHGYFSFKQLYRKGLSELMNRLRNRFSLFLLSGDNDADKKFLSEFYSQDEMKFNQSPADKLNFIEYLQKQGKKVVMAGDGLNDAGALQQADAGISITDKITHFTPASDVIMDGKIVERLPEILRFTRSGLKIIKVIFIISLIYNVIGISFAVQGALSPLVAAILMPVSAFTVIILSYVFVYIIAKRQKFT